VVNDFNVWWVVVGYGVWTSHGGLEGADGDRKRSLVIGAILKFWQFLLHWLRKSKGLDRWWMDESRGTATLMEATRKSLAIRTILKFWRFLLH
jgi:hypothetical protein